MKNINDEYYIVLDDYRGDTTPIDKKSEFPVFVDEDLTEPIHYAMDEEYWHEGDKPKDIISPDIQGLLIKDYQKNELFYKYNPDKIKLHPAYITSPNNETFFEGYWLAMVNDDMPANWLDVENSVMLLDDEAEANDCAYWDIDKFQLNTKVLEKVPLEDRLFFTLDHDAYNNLSFIIHESLVKYLKKVANKDREVVFIPISEYYKGLTIDEWLEGDITII